MASNEGRFKGSAEAVEQKAAGVMEGVRDFASSAKETARDSVERVKEKAADVYEHSRDKLADWNDSAQGYIQREPLKALAIAAGVGLLLGVLLTRRSD